MQKDIHEREGSAVQRIAKTNLRDLLVLAAVYALYAVTSPISYASSLLYGFLTLLWSFSVRDRLTHRRMQHSLFVMALMLCLMFPMRVRVCCCPAGRSLPC